MIKQLWKKHKGEITTQKLVLIVIGVAVMAVTVMTVQGAIDSAYAEALENAMHNHD